MGGSALAVAQWLWDVLTAAGSALALSFIVVLALGINALMVFYLGSAVVVLDRFARVARSPLWIGFFGLVVALVAGVLVARLYGAEQVVPALAASAAATAICMGLSATALRFASPVGLGTFSLIGLGLAAALFVGATAELAYAVAPAGTMAVIAAALALVRRRSGSGSGTETERQVRWLTAALFAAVPLALVLPEPAPEIAAVGAGAVQVFFALIVFGLLPLAAAGLAGARESAEWFVALRYMVAQRRQVFLSAITLICIFGIAAGVWLIITVSSVMNGFERTWREEIIGNRAHFTVHNSVGPMEHYDDVLELVRENPSVTGASPYLDAEGMIRGRDGKVFAVRLRGIDPETVREVTDLHSDLVEGSLDALQAAGSGRPGIILGKALADQVGIGVGSEILLIAPFGGPQTPLGPAPRLRPFEVVGLFESKFFQYDELYTYVHLSAAQDFKALGDVVDGVEARTLDLYRSARIAAEIGDRLDYPYFTRDWKDYFPAIFEMLRDNRTMMLFLLSAIMVVAAFLIVATLLMMIMEKSADISILKTMGASNDTIERIFAIEGTLIGLAGTLLGVVAGIAVTTQLPWIQGRIEAITGIDTLPANIYQVSTLPSEVDAVQVSMVAAMAMILSLGATLVPSRQGASLDPAEGLRDR